MSKAERSLYTQVRTGQTLWIVGNHPRLLDSLSLIDSRIRLGMPLAYDTQSAFNYAVRGAKRLQKFGTSPLLPVFVRRSDHDPLLKP